MERNYELHDDDSAVVGQPLSYCWMTPKLAVSQRMYELECLFHMFLSDTLVLPYVDSTCVLRTRFPARRRRDLARPFEPFIAAVLISRAPSLEGVRSGPDGAGEKSGMDSLITTDATPLHALRRPARHSCLHGAHIPRLARPLPLSQPATCSLHG